jgi:meso-butanediol dehydrogenase/(S,S)-butanediol dehydrogenase/diacetyl reductase
MKEFKGKTVVVTGAASGIGFGLAERFAQEKMNVVLADIEQDALDAAVAKDVDIAECIN